MEPRCPQCGKSLDTVVYVEHGRGVKRWHDEKRTWVEGDFWGEIDYQCPECEYAFTYEELEEMGVV